MCLLALHCKHCKSISRECEGMLSQQFENTCFSFYYQLFSLILSLREQLQKSTVSQYSMVVRSLPFISVLGRQGQVDTCKLEGSLVYIMNSKPPNATF